MYFKTFFILIFFCKSIYFIDKDKLALSQAQVALEEKLVPAAEAIKTRGTTTCQAAHNSKPWLYTINKEGKLAIYNQMQKHTH